MNKRTHPAKRICKAVLDPRDIRSNKKNIVFNTESPYIYRQVAKGTRYRATLFVGVTDSSSVAGSYSHSLP